MDNEMDRNRMPTCVFCGAPLLPDLDEDDIEALLEEAFADYEPIGEGTEQRRLSAVDAYAGYRPDYLDTWMAGLSRELRIALTLHVVNDDDMVLNRLPPELDEEYTRAQLKLFTADERLAELFRRMMCAEFRDGCRDTDA